MAKVQYFSTVNQYKEISKTFEKSAKKILSSGRYILGEPVQKFEKDFSKYCGARYGVGVGSGTDALIFALKALGIKKGDEVITPSFTFVATVFAIMHVGATPVFADVNAKTYTLDPESTAKAITKKTKAILPVHLYGQCADMGKLKKLAKKKKLLIVEDAAQAHGARIGKRRAGSFGDAGCFSFYPTKNLGACGDGGMVVTNHKKVVSDAQTFRNLGRPIQKGDHQVAAWTSRLDALQASFLGIKLKKLETYNRKRRQVANRYTQGLKNTPLVTPFEAKGNYHVYHLYVVLVPNGKRNALQKHLEKKGIPTMVHYPKAVHLQPAYTRVHKRKWKLPVTTTISKQILSLPIYPEMSLRDVDRVTKAVHRFYAK